MIFLLKSLESTKDDHPRALVPLSGLSTTECMFLACTSGSKVILTCATCLAECTILKDPLSVRPRFPMDHIVPTNHKKLSTMVASTFCGVVGILNLFTNQPLPKIGPKTLAPCFIYPFWQRTTFLSSITVFCRIVVAFLFRGLPFFNLYNHNLLLQSLILAHFHSTRL